MSETVEQIVERAVASSVVPSGETVAIELRDLWYTVVRGASTTPAADLGQDEATLEGLLAFVQAAHALDGSGGEQLQLRSGGWEVDASGGLVRAGLSAAVLTGVLALAGVTAVAPILLPAVLPLLFDVRRTKVSASHRELLTELAPLPDVLGVPLTARELYERLPEDIRDEVSRLELADFMAELYDAGLADKKGDTFVLREPDRARMRIKLR